MLFGASNLLGVMHQQLATVSAGINIDASPSRQPDLPEEETDTVRSTKAACYSLGVESVAEVVPMGLILFIMLILQQQRSQLV